MRRSWLSLSVLVLAAVGLAAAAAGSSETVTLRKVSVNGKTETVLASAKGMTLYYFKKDKPGTAACTGGCAKLWPPLLLASGQPTGPASIAKGLKAFQGADGRQVEYDGHPLYTYSADKAPGDVKGEGLYHAWYVLAPTADPNGGGAATSSAQKSASSSAATSSSSNGGW